jgi:hypothetical protein
MPGFWDAMSPFYRRLPPPVPLMPTATVDQVGQALVGGVAVVTVAHGAASYVRSRRTQAAERRDALAAEAAVAVGDEAEAALAAGPVAPPDTAVEADVRPEVAADDQVAEALLPGSDAAAAPEAR